MEVSTKDGREFRFLFSTLEDNPLGDIVFNRIKIIAFTNESQYFFAFCFKQPALAAKGWDIFNDYREWERMGIDYSLKVFFIIIHYFITRMLNIECAYQILILNYVQHTLPAS